MTTKKVTKAARKRSSMIVVLKTHRDDLFLPPVRVVWKTLISGVAFALERRTQPTSRKSEVLEIHLVASAHPLLKQSVDP